MAQQPVLGALVMIAKTLREKGSASPGELMEKVGVPRRTFYRALGALKEAGVILDAGGVYYWHEFADISRYGSEFEAEQALHHSRNIASGLKHVLGGRHTYFAEGDLVPKAEYAEHALTHLRTGFRGTYEVFQEAEEVKTRTNTEEHRFKEGLEGKLRAFLPQLPYPRSVAEIILYDVKEVLRGHEPYFLASLRVEGEEVKSGSYTLAKREGFESLKNFIMKEEALKENRESCGKIVELENKHWTLRQEFEREIEGLIMQVENGTPLKGSCQMCPSVKVSAHPTALP